MADPIIERRRTIKTKRAQSRIDKDECDRLFSLIIRAPRRCERCGKTDARFECAHIIGRRYTATRCMYTNAWCLCSGCHRRLTENPHEHVAFANETRGVDGYLELQQLAYAGVGGSKIDWHETRRELKTRAVELGVI